MNTQIRFVTLLVFVMTAALSVAAQSDRFEVTSLKAVRPTIVATIAALQKGDVKAAKAAFDAYDSAWNGVEVYINTRDKEMYAALEQGFQARITKALAEPAPNAAAIRADAEAMLKKFDEAVANVQKAEPLNSLYDDVARLRMERAHLREVTPAVKAGDFAKARKSFMEFEDNWDNIEDHFRERSLDAYNGIEGAMPPLEKALKAATPDVNQITAMVSKIMDQYNAIVTQITKEAREAR